VSTRSRWWEGGALYECYVRSWQDSDGDGFGDLAGVRRRLDHLAWLGVDAVWLSPINPSPDADWGYDVSDYTAVHPELGTMDQLEALVAEADRLGLAVVLDLVPNHTSAEHAWFAESRSGRDAGRRDWYVWADPGPEGGPPNNWLDATGQSAWTLDEASGQYYLHNFLDTQPDLNWWNDEVHAAFGEILRFWFDRGVSGFRIDVAHSLYKDAALRDDPQAEVTPESRFGLLHVHSMNRPETHQVYRDWRKLADEYDPCRLLLGETWVLDVERLASFYGDDDELQLAFNFAFLFSPLDAGQLSAVVAQTLAALPPGACPTWAGSNHDVSRFPTRWADGDPARTRLALTVLCTLPGTTVLYYGDELGLTDVEVGRDDQRDRMTWRAVDNRYNRDRARTPMPWEPGPGSGFTAAGVTPWLPLGDRQGVTVAEQREDPGSTLWLTRHLLRLRREAYGGEVVPYQALAAGPRQWVYRCGPLVVAANFAGEEAVVDVPAGEVALSSAPAQASIAGEEGVGAGRSVVAGALALRPWEAVVVKSDGALPERGARGGNHGPHRP
jgi:alpha-glucosidase